jgi:crotonobetainyl-CoA:carnitine CoA-transferase CaiB-like acyl-CoA transferase
VANRAAIDEVLAPVIAGLDVGAAVATLHVAGIGCAVVNRLDEMVDHPQLSTRERWVRVDAPHGPVWTPLAPPVSSAWTTPAGAVPALGQHTDAILAELGRDTATIRRLRDSGVV